jgi:hypothetical protein
MATSMVPFSEFPTEIRDAIWTLAVEPEIISIKMVRKVNQTPSKIRQTPYQAALEEFTFSYDMGAVRIDFGGQVLRLCGLRGASVESRSVFFKVKHHRIHLLRRGQPIWFNPLTDVIHFGNLTRIYLHHMRQRKRVPLPFLKGLHNARKIVLDVEPDEQQLENLAKEVRDEFSVSILEIETSWFIGGESYKKDLGWDAAVREEMHHLGQEMTPRQIRLSKALRKVNGGYIDVGTKILRLSLTDMEGTGSESSL